MENDQNTGHVSLASVFLGHALQPYSDWKRVPPRKCCYSVHLADGTAGHILPESTLVPLAGCGASTLASWPLLSSSSFLCIPEALGQRSVEERE